MRGKCSLAHLGSSSSSQRANASSRHASIHSGSFFWAEMKRTMSSDRPLGALSDSMSVTNPYLYWSTSMRRTRSIVSCTAGIHSSAHGVKARGLDCRLWSVRFRVVTPPRRRFPDGFQSYIGPSPASPKHLEWSQHLHLWLHSQDLHGS